VISTSFEGLVGKPNGKWGAMGPVDTNSGRTAQIRDPRRSVRRRGIAVFVAALRIRNCSSGNSGIAIRPQVGCREPMRKRPQPSLGTLPLSEALFKPVKLDNARNSRYPFGLPSFDQG
jgi:hypothetical protein